ncbi:MAG: NADH dehydrogenase FAD-containing subunit [Lentisphaeria bacterium]|nr:NADH dehydrogenase FAD-containing subunit [Lentisphaeria bacterium]
MIIALLLLVPVLAALAAFLSRSEKFSRYILVAAGTAHAVLCGLLPGSNETLNPGGKICLALDADGLVILSVTSGLFLLTSLFITFWMPLDTRRAEGHAVMKTPHFSAFLLLFLFTMTLTALARDFGMLWVAVEATTLASAPLINYHKSKTSLEAMWKYLLICSIGIGLALFGTMLIAASLADPHAGLAFDTLKNSGIYGKFNVVYFRAGFVLCFAGYALKMGLAPFHTWLPDAHSEAPAPVSALLSGSLLNCALLAVLRLWHITPVTMQDFCGNFLKFSGFLSLAVAALFIIRQKDFKRMLAYSSVEHMGLITLLVAYGLEHIGMLHVISHSLTKMALFLTAGNILLSYRTRSVAAVKGIFSRIPGNAAIWIFGMLMICGTPPSPLFFTELALVTAAGIIPGTIILLLLLLIFCGMSQLMLGMCARAPEKLSIDCDVEKLTGVPMLAMILVSLLGILIGASWIIAG